MERGRAGPRAQGGMRGMMKRTIPLGALGVAAVLLAQPAIEKDTQFWNLTSSTVKSLELAPAGTTAWGPNQCANDPDGAVDHEERLKLVGIRPGRYDVKLTNKTGRHCLIRNVDINENGIFSIADKDLSECER